MGGCLLFFFLSRLSKDVEVMGLDHVMQHEFSNRGLDMSSSRKRTRQEVCTITVFSQFSL